MRKVVYLILLVIKEPPYEYKQLCSITVNAAFSSLEREAKEVGLIVNEGRTGYLKAAQPRVLGNTSLLAALKTVKNFVYLGTSIYTTNNLAIKINRRITLANSC